MVTIVEGGARAETLSVTTVRLGLAGVWFSTLGPAVVATGKGGRGAIASKQTPRGKASCTADGRYADVFM